MEQHKGLESLVPTGAWPEAEHLVPLLEAHWKSHIPAHQTLFSEAQKANWAVLLTPYLHHLIQNRLSDLLHLLYRVDVAEHRFRSALAQAQGLEQAAEATARLIIERLEKKRYFRLTYGKLAQEHGKARS